MLFSVARHIVFSDYFSKDPSFLDMDRGVRSERCGFLHRNCFTIRKYNRHLSNYVSEIWTILRILQTALSHFVRFTFISDSVNKENIVNGLNIAGIIQTNFNLEKRPCLPSINKEKKRFRVYIGNLPELTTKKCIINLLEQFGIVHKTITVHKSFAFVDTTNEISRDRAIETLNGYKFKNSHLIVELPHEESIPRSKKSNFSRTTKRFNRNSNIDIPLPATSDHSCDPSVEMNKFVSDAEIKSFETNITEKKPSFVKSKYASRKPKSNVDTKRQNFSKISSSSSSVSASPRNKKLSPGVADNSSKVVGTKKACKKIFYSNPDNSGVLISVAGTEQEKAELSNPMQKQDFKDDN